MKPKLSKEIKSMGTTLLIVWLTCFFAGVYTVWNFRRDIEMSGDISGLQEQGLALMIGIALSFFVSLGVVVFSIFKSVKFNKALKSENINGGKWLILASVSLLLPTLLSFQSLIGVNLMFLSVTNGIGDLTIFGWLTVIASILWLLFPIFQLIGIREISEGDYNKFNALGSFVELKKYATILLVVAVVFSPFVMGWVSVNKQKFESVIIFNIIAALALLSAIGLYYRSWLKATDANLITADKLIPKVYVEISGAVRSLISKIGLSYVIFGFSIALTSLFTILYLEELSIIYAILLVVLYVIGWFGIINGLCATYKLKQLITPDRNFGVKIVIASFAIAAFVSFLSFSSPIGINIFKGDVIWSHKIGRMFEHLEYTFISMDNLLFSLSVIAMTVYTLFGITTLCGTIHLSRLFPGLKKGIPGASVILLCTLIFSPFLLVTQEREYESNFLLCVIGSVIFLAAVFTLMRSWQNCEAMLENSVEGIATDEDSSANESIATTLKKNKILGTIAILCIISIICSMVFCIMNIVERSKEDKVDSNKVEALEEGVNEIDVDNLNAEENDNDSFVADNQNDDNELNIKVLTDMYLNLVLNLAVADDTWGDNFIQEHLSPEMRKRLMDDYDFDDGGYAWWTLRSWEKKYTSNHSELKEIERLDNGWYRVNYIDNGVEDYKDLRVVNGVIKEYK